MRAKTNIHIARSQRSARVYLTSKPLDLDIPYQIRVPHPDHSQHLAHWNRLINKRGGAADACCAADSITRADSPGIRASSAKAASIGAMAATRGHTTPAPAALARRRAHAASSNVRRPARAALGAGLASPAAFTPWSPPPRRPPSTPPGCAALRCARRRPEPYPLKNPHIRASCALTAWAINEDVQGIRGNGAARARSLQPWPRALQSLCALRTSPSYAGHN